MNKKEMGKKSRAAGTAFERRVRKDLEEKDWIVCKWQNNILDDKLIPAKHTFNPFTKAMSAGNGFPDFIAYSILDYSYDVIGVESKMNGKLDKAEKEKCKWYLDNKIFSKILIASKTKVGRKIIVHYEEF